MHKNRPLLKRLIIANLCASIFLATGLWVNYQFLPKLVLRLNWGIEIPLNAKVVEHESEESFTGDGDRFTLFELKSQISLRGSSLDPKYMTDENFSLEELALISEINQALDVKNPLDTGTNALLKRTLKGLPGTSFETLLAIYDASSGLIYIYERII